MLIVFFKNIMVFTSPGLYSNKHCNQSTWLTLFPTKKTLNCRTCKSKQTCHATHFQLYKHTCTINRLSFAVIGYQYPIKCSCSKAFAGNTKTQNNTIQFSFEEISQHSTHDMNKPLQTARST